ncbi:MAG: hypothetical protein ACYTFG_03705 [Planctomycetota bacterium]
MRSTIAGALVTLALCGPALAAGVQLASGEGDIKSALRADKSACERDTTHQRAGKPVIRWADIELESRLEFLHAGNIDFAKMEKISLWIHSGTMQSKSILIVATDDPENLSDSFYFRLMLTWAGWHLVEIPLVRFSRRGAIRIAQVKSLFMEYTESEGGEVYIDDVRLLAAGETVQTPDPPSGKKPNDKGEKTVLAAFEKGPASLVRWVSRDSKAEISKDKVRNGVGALRWSNVKKGSSLEFLQGPFSVTGFDRLGLNVFVTRAVAKGFYLAFGNDGDRLAFADVSPLQAGWNRVIVPLQAFVTRGRINRSYVEHLMFLYEGAQEITVVLDDLSLIAPAAGNKPTQGVGPGEEPLPESPGVKLDGEGNVLVAGPGVSPRPTARRSRAVHTSEKWYSREGRKSIRWYDLEENSELHFVGVPRTVKRFRHLEAWIYADAPAGVLGVTLMGTGGEAWITVEVDWIGWKRCEFKVDSFEGVRSLGNCEGLMFTFEGKKGGLREFFFDEVRILKR